MRNGRKYDGTMQNGTALSKRLIRFIDHVIDTYGVAGHQPSILDLRVECRRQRMTEFSDWPSAELNLIEHEAVRYGDQTILTRVLSGEAIATAITIDSFLPSPSLLAWT